MLWNCKCCCFTPTMRIRVIIKAFMISRNFVINLDHSSNGSRHCWGFSCAKIGDENNYNFLWHIADKVSRHYLDGRTATLSYNMQNYWSTYSVCKNSALLLKSDVIEFICEKLRRHCDDFGVFPHHLVITRWIIKSSSQITLLRFHLLVLWFLLIESFTSAYLYLAKRMKL